jgi:hypothetical protein
VAAESLWIWLAEGTALYVDGRIRVNAVRAADESEAREIFARIYPGRDVHASDMAFVRELIDDRKPMNTIVPPQRYVADTEPNGEGGTRATLRAAPNGPLILWDHHERIVELWRIRATAAESKVRELQRGQVPG